MVGCCFQIEASRLLVYDSTDSLELNLEIPVKDSYKHERVLRYRPGRSTADIQGGIYK